MGGSRLIESDSTLLRTHWQFLEAKSVFKISETLVGMDCKGRRRGGYGMREGDLEQ